MSEQLTYYRNEICNNLEAINEKIQYLIDNGFFMNEEGMVLAHKSQSEENDNNSSDASHITETDKDIDYYYILKPNGQFERLEKVDSRTFTHGYSGGYYNTTYKSYKCDIEEVMMETDFDIFYRYSFRRNDFENIFITSRVSECTHDEYISYIKRVGNSKGDGLIQILDNIMTDIDARNLAISDYNKIINEIADQEKRQTDKISSEKKQKRAEKRKLWKKRISIILNAIISLFLCVYIFIYMGKYLYFDLAGYKVPISAFLLSVCYLFTLGFNLLWAFYDINALLIMLAILQTLCYLFFSFMSGINSNEWSLLQMNCVLYIVMFIVVKLIQKILEKRR